MRVEKGNKVQRHRTYTPLMETLQSLPPNLLKLSLPQRFHVSTVSGYRNDFPKCLA